MKSIVFFNNKGGVGKTTLACNVVAYLSIKMGKRVLLVDADPQCNATQAILTDERCETIYLDSDSKQKTLYSYLRPLEDGEPSVDIEIEPIAGGEHRYGADLIPGHPRMSIVEDRLSQAWSEALGGQVGGARITNWAHKFMSAVSDQYDLIVFDVGPSLGALNRTIILGSDYVVTPFGSDIFSLLGIRNISQWITNWEKLYLKALINLEDTSPGAAERYDLITDTSEHFRFAGYSIQQYVTRTFASGPRVVGSYDKIIKQIPSTVASSIGFLRPGYLSEEETKLGDVPFVYSLVPMSQASKTPIPALSGGEGIKGNQYGQVKKYQDLMESLCGRLLKNVGAE